MILLNLLFTLLQPQQDTLASRYVDRYELCHITHVSNSYVALTFVNETDFTLYKSVSSGLVTPTSSKFYFGKYKLAKGHIILYPSGKETEALNEVTYKVEGMTLVKVDNPDDFSTIFPVKLTEENTFNAEYERKTNEAADTTSSQQYFHYTQICHFLWATEYFWKLKLSANNHFTLTEIVSDNRFSNDLSALKKSKFGVNPKFTSGLWEQKGDTIKLKIAYSTASILNTSGDEYSFIQSKDCLTIIPNNKGNIPIFPKQLCLNAIKPKQN